MQLWDWDGVDWVDAVGQKRQWLRSTIVLRSERQFSQGFRQHQDAGGDGLWRGILIRPVAEAAPARDEQHGYRSYARHEQRIVVGPAHHVLATKAVFRRAARQGFHDPGVTLG